MQWMLIVVGKIIGVHSADIVVVLQKKVVEVSLREGKKKRKEAF